MNYSRPTLKPFLVLSLLITVLASVACVVIDGLLYPQIELQPRGQLLLFCGAAAPFLVMVLAVRAIRKRVSEAESTEVKFRSLLEAAPDAIVIVDRKGTIVLVNTQTEEMFGYARKDLLGKTFEDIVHQDNREVIGENGAATAWATITARLEHTPTFVGLCKDGRRIALEINFNPLETKTGPLLISTIRDITERRGREIHRAARQAVRRILADADELTEAAPVILGGLCGGLGWDLGALWVVDGPAGLLRRAGLWHRSNVVPAAAEVMADARAGLPGAVWKSGKPAWLPDFAATPDATGRAGRAGRLSLAFPVVLGQQVLGVLEFRSPEPGEPDEDLLETLGNVSGQVAHFLQRRRAEQAVCESEARKTAVLEAAVDAIVTIDRHGKIVECNPAAIDLFRLPRGEALGGNLAALLPAGPAGRFRLSLAEYLATGDAAVLARRVEMIGLRADGAEFPLELTVTPIRIDGPALFTAYIRDLSERKSAEEALRQTEERFRQAQKMEAVGRLAGGVAHDFNNLLTVITGCTEILLEDFPQTAETRDLLEEVRNAGTRASKLTSQLLAFSRRQVLAPKVVDLNGIVSEMDRMLRRLIGEDVNLVTVQGRNLERVKVDPAQIEQVLMNLVVNARDAMPAGGKLTIETANVDLDEAAVQAYPELPAGSYVLLAVSDTGCGMDRAVRARLFEPFFTTKEVGKGTGLGLATVYGIVKQSRGHITAYSEPGHGTTFKLYLPCVHEPLSEMLRRSESPVPPLGAGTVLLVEDEDEVRVLTRRSLQRQGYQVLEARNGREALEVWRQEGGAIDLVVTDVVMPEMNGGELARRLLAERPDLKVLFLSGYTDSAVLRHNLLEEGMAFLQKPFTPKGLARKVYEIMSAPPAESGPGWTAEEEMVAEPEEAHCR